MLRLLTHVQLAYVGLFLAACVGVLAYQSYYVWPAQHCEQHGGWWSVKYHTCGTPIPIWRITGRIPQGTNPIASTQIAPTQLTPNLAVSTQAAAIAAPSSPAH